MYSWKHSAFSSEDHSEAIHVLPNVNCKLSDAFVVIYRACLLYFCDYGCLLYYPVQYQYTYGTKGQFQAVFLYCRVYFYWSSSSNFWLTL